MATAAQKHANKQNAKHSTGPRTAEGKQHSSRNAIKHGLRAEDPLIPGEDPDAFEEHACEIFGDLKPCHYIEEQLVDQLADISWRLKRLSRIEAAVITEFYDAAAKEPSNQGADTDQLLGKALADDKHLAALNRLGRYEAQLSRRYHRVLKEFRDTRQRRIRGIVFGGAFGRLAAKPRPEQSANTGHKSKNTKPTQSIETLLESIAPMNGPANGHDPSPPAITNLHQIHQESPDLGANPEAQK